MTQPRIIRVTDPEASAQEARDELRDVHTLMMVRGVVTEAVAEAVKLHMPTSEERAYLGLAVRRAARREALQRAIIEKSLTGLVWAAVVFVGVVFFEYLQAHGWKA